MPSGCPKCPRRRGGIDRTYYNCKDIRPYPLYQEYIDYNGNDIIQILIAII